MPAYPFYRLPHPRPTKTEKKTTKKEKGHCVCFTFDFLPSWCVTWEGLWGEAMRRKMDATRKHTFLQGLEEKCQIFCKTALESNERENQETSGKVCCW